MTRRSPDASSRGTLASLAAELGVSRTTVSNAYNHPEQLSAELRKRILATAAARGYPGPDPTARSLRTRRTNSVGVLLTEHLTYGFDDAASVDFLAGVAEASIGADTSLTLIPVGPSSTLGSGLVARAVVDGFLVYSVAEDDPNLAAVRARGLPTVVCGQPGTLEDVPFVGINDRHAIRPAVQALVDAGHRRVGIVTIRMDLRQPDGPVELGDVTGAGFHIQRDRVLGALDVLEKAGVAPERVPVVVRQINDPINAASAARELLDSHPDLTAVVCTTDSMAFGVLDVARERGLRVPEDLSVTGFDGVARALELGLTTVIQPNRLKGKEAGRLLLRLVEENSLTHQRVLLPTEFFPGSTVAIPRN